MREIPFLNTYASTYVWNADNGLSLVGDCRPVSIVKEGRSGESQAAGECGRNM